VNIKGNVNEEDGVKARVEARLRLGLRCVMLESPDHIDDALVHSTSKGSNNLDTANFRCTGLGLRLSPRM